MKIEMYDDENFGEGGTFTVDAVYQMIRSFFAALGLMAVAALIGLWYGGFFHWLGTQYPDGVLSLLWGGLK